MMPRATGPKTMEKPTKEDEMDRQYITTGEIDTWGVLSTNLCVDGELEILGEARDRYNPYYSILEAETSGGTRIYVFRDRDDYYTA